MISDNLHWYYCPNSRGAHLASVGLDLIDCVIAHLHEWRRHVKKPKDSSLNGNDIKCQCAPMWAYCCRGKYQNNWEGAPVECNSYGRCTYLRWGCAIAVQRKYVVHQSVHLLVWLIGVPTMEKLLRYMCENCSRRAPNVIHRCSTVIVSAIMTWRVCRQKGEVTPHKKTRAQLWKHVPALQNI